MKSKMIGSAFVIMCVTACFAHPCGAWHRHGFHRPPPIHHGWHGGHCHHHYHGCCRGHGGWCFWPGLAGGVIGGVAGTTLMRPYCIDKVVVQPVTTVIATPSVVQPPIVVQEVPEVVQQPIRQVQNIWVEGRYVDQMLANGSTVRIWQPGHYELLQKKVQ